MQLSAGQTLALPCSARENLPIALKASLVPLALITEVTALDVTKVINVAFGAARHVRSATAVEDLTELAVAHHIEPGEDAVIHRVFDRGDERVNFLLCHGPDHFCVLGGSTDFGGHCFFAQSIAQVRTIESILGSSIESVMFAA